MTKFTVVVPTRERADTLFWTLKTCVAQDYDNLTILVSDNCSQDNTEEVIKSFNDPRIRYIKTPGRISMSANWDFALEHVRDGYVCFIGDDDGLIPNTFKIIDGIFQTENVDAITSKDMAIYYWPNHIDDEYRGNLSLSIRPTYHVLDTKKYFRKSVEAISCVHLPQLYHGFVKAEVFHQIRKKQDHFFKSSCPDIYSGVVLGSILTRHIFSAYPLTIHGLSQHSIGSSSAMVNKKTGIVEQFWKENPPPFHEKLALCSATSMIYADSFLHASRYFPEIPELDLKKVIAAAYGNIARVKLSETRNSVIEALRVMGDKNNLRDYVEEIIKKGLESKPFVFKQWYGYNPVKEMIRLKTTDFGLQNVYDVFQLCRNLLPQNIYKHVDRPPADVSVLDLFRNSFRALRERIK